MAAVAGPIAEHLGVLQERYPAASVVSAPGGASLIKIPDVSLPSGWSQSTTEILFIAPVGYPVARPDCFWADVGLRLGNGGMPKSSGINTPPGGDGNRLWFSWHLQRWDPSRDDFIHYLRVIGRRFEERN